MKRLSKETMKQIDAALQAMADSAEDLSNAIERYNTALDEVRGDVDDALIRYNEQARGLKSLYRDAAGEAREYYDEQSEKWQEGEAGQQYQAWLDSLESVDIETFDIDLPDDLYEPPIPDFNDSSWLPAEAPGEE